MREFKDVQDLACRLGIVYFDKETYYYLHPETSYLTTSVECCWIGNKSAPANQVIKIAGLEYNLRFDSQGPYLNTPLTRFKYIKVELI